MNTDWDLLMNSIKTFQRSKYTLEPVAPLGVKYGNRNVPEYNFIEKNIRYVGSHKEKKEYLKINKIKGYSKCTNHQQLNKLLMSF